MRSRSQRWSCGNWWVEWDLVLRGRKYESKESFMTAVRLLRAASYLAGCQGFINVCEGKVSLFVGLQIRQAIIVSIWCEVVSCAHVSIQLIFFLIVKWASLDILAKQHISSTGYNTRKITKTSTRCRKSNYIDTRLVNTTKNRLQQQSPPFL